MKRFTLMIMAALLMLAAVSCKKDSTTNSDSNNTNTANDGVYSPSRKISDYYSWGDYDYSWIHRESWNWENRKLMSIDHLTEYGDVSWSELYTYQGARIVRVERDDDYPRYMEFSYRTDGRIAKACYYREDQLREEYKFNYSGEKVNEIEYTGYYYDDKSSSDEHGSWLIPEHKRNMSDGDTEHIVAKIAWVGNNISKITTNYEEDMGEGYTLKRETEYSMEYDAKNNPKKGFLNFYSFRELEELYVFFNQNNITKEKHSYKETYYYQGVQGETYSESYEYVYSYEYDNYGYPLERVESEVGYDYQYKEKFEYLQ